MTSQQQPSTLNTQQRFANLWPQANQQGWHLVPMGSNKQEQVVFPPTNHPAALDNWTGIYRNVNYDNHHVAVPHWFYSEVGNNNPQSSLQIPNTKTKRKFFLFN